MPGLLRLEKKWITKDPFICRGTTFMGINATDTYLLANYHKVINYSSSACEEKEQKISIQRLAGILAQQLIDMAKKISGRPLRFLLEDSEGSGIELRIGDAKSDFSSPTLRHHFLAMFHKKKNDSLTT
jgi:hypothetical protein